jgi:hypothetical protein
MHYELFAGSQFAGMEHIRTVRIRMCCCLLVQLLPGTQYMCCTETTAASTAAAAIAFCRDIGFLSKLNCYWFFCRYFVFAIVTIVALLASPIVLWLDPWIWGFPTIYFLVSANVAVVVYLYFTIFSYIFLLFSVVSATGWQPGLLACSRVLLHC